uniref:Glutaredoxin domain-containing protein n=1 Tax=Octactis speculum TaxID=3111310 RepID=A0A7S2MEG7_9STRA|mmetsp:Transcript_60897/g.83627  ORF Transcript_60897/g.83627 Transcript_60897/m.83627 type:complete len:158 (+) Transcript_60897:53-526(+)
MNFCQRTALSTSRHLRFKSTGIIGVTSQSVSLHTSSTKNTHLPWITPTRSFSGDSSCDATLKVRELIAAEDILIFSKTTCGFCARVKTAAMKLGVLERATIVELNVVPDGSDLQTSLMELTGQRTVPNVFVKGTHIGGCDDTMQSIDQGDFLKLLNA